MSRRHGMAILLLLAAALAPRGVRGEEEPAGDGIEWLRDLDEAYAVARARGRALFLALHFRSASPQPAWPEDPRPWRAIYRDPAVVARSRAFVCVQPPLRPAPPSGHATGPIHLVLGPSGRRLAGSLAWSHPPGRPSVVALLDLLAVAGGGRPRPPEQAGAEERPPGRRGLGTGPFARLALPPGAEGVRVHLGFAGRVPELPPEVDAVRARVLAAWDGGPLREVGALVLSAGDVAADLPVDVRFASLGVSAGPLRSGPHRIDLWLTPAPGAWPFSATPLHAGVVYVDVEEDGAGGGEGPGAEPDGPEPDEEEPTPRSPPPSGPGAEPDPPPADEGRTEVVDPLVRDDRDRVRKEDAVVAVPDPEAGLDPPPLVPLADAMRDFGRVVERALGGERIRPADREFLLRYFRTLGGRSGSEGGR